MSIVPGSRVTLHYSLRLEGGFVADRTETEPMTFVVGDGAMAPALEQHLLGLNPGDEREFAIAPGTAFPFPTETAVQTLEHDLFPADSPPVPGTILEFHTPAGDVVPGRILSVDEAAVTVDFNHPLAGQVFFFQVRILEVQAS